MKAPFHEVEKSSAGGGASGSAGRSRAGLVIGRRNVAVFTLTSEGCKIRSGWKRFADCRNLFIYSPDQVVSSWVGGHNSSSDPLSCKDAAIG